MTNIRELYNNLIVKLILITKDVLVLEPKHSIVEYGRSHRSNIKFVEGGALTPNSVNGYSKKFGVKVSEFRKNLIV